jgi:putative FmdB family regulatory protein
LYGHGPLVPFGISMPIYEYRCPNGHLFELFQRMSDAPPEQCEVCGASPVERVLHPVAVHYKGSGFYTTDYGKGSKRSGPSKDGDSSSSSSSSSGDSGSSSGSDSGSGSGSDEKKAAEA